MNAVTLETQDDRFLISIDRDYVDQEFLINLVERIKLEHLVRKAGFDESIEELGEQIKADWWAANRDRFLNREP
ncbi:hypothetical protein FAES_4142 [Fibrella aestuarina BUZ 2]|uniref:Uncharacterized protein n=1 Tax=Fibrella aestuarina BUZ 2 TaxID=1166018 RepID=I0KDD9_9BACT|nr:hypothetical protein [Fibrella aestuarina]CCH02142.1 hypothetical protein FAES_4142 [Fibrella aestuarina BUZ 2]